MALLKVEGVSKNFGGLMALSEVSFEAQKGDLLGIIGPNGAGKTTLFNIISGFYAPSKGEIYFNETRIDGLKSHVICKRGLARTFQIAQPFLGFTPHETLITAALNRLPLKRAKEKAMEVLEMVGLADKAKEDGGSLTILDKKALELAKAMATGSEMVLLDEVMAGLTLVEAEHFMSLIKRLSDGGITFLMVEHVMFIIMKLCSRIMVLNFGQKIAEGTAAEVSKNQMVIDSYFGEELKIVT